MSIFFDSTLLKLCVEEKGIYCIYIVYASEYEDSVKYKNKGSNFFKL